MSDSAPAPAVPVAAGDATARGWRFWLTICVVVLGVVALSIRAALIWALPADGERWSLVESLVPGVQIEVQSSQHRLVGYYPGASVRNLQVAGADGFAATVDDAEVLLDPWESFVARAPVLRRLRLGAAHIRVAQDASGAWRLPQGEQPGSLQPWLELLTRSDLIAVEDLRVTLQPYVGDAVVLTVKGQLENIDDGHRGRLAVTCGDGCGGELQIGADLSGGESFALQVDGLPHMVGFVRSGTFAADLHSGSGSLRGSLSTPTRRGGVTGQWHVQGAVSNGEQRLPWSITADRIGGGWLKGQLALNLPEVMLQLGSEDLRFQSIAATAEDSVTSIVLPKLNVSQLVGPLLSSGVLTGAAQEWLSALRPGGRLSEVRTRLFPDGTIALAADFDSLTLTGYKGVPEIAGASGEMLAYEHGAFVRLDKRVIDFGLPRLFAQNLKNISAVGDAQIYFGDQELRIHSGALAGTALGGNFGGRFGLYRPQLIDDQFLSVRIELEGTDIPRAMPYLPTPIQGGLRSWLETAAGPGTIEHGDLLFSGHVLVVPGEPRKHTEIGARLRDAQVRFDPHWPIAEQVAAVLEFSNRDLHGTVEQAVVQGVGLTEPGLIHIAPDSDLLLVAGVGRATPDDAVQLLLATPVADAAGWLDEWRGDLEVGFSARGAIPIGAAAGDEPELVIDIELGGATLRNEALALDLTELEGDVRYEYPAALVSQSVVGRLNGLPASGSIEDQGDALLFRTSGWADGRWAEAWLPTGSAKLVDGSFGYRAELLIPASDAPVSLSAWTDFEGLAFLLPVPVAKAAQRRLPTNAEIEFRSDVTDIALTSPELTARLELADGELLRATIAFDELVQELPETGILVQGSVPELAALAWSEVIQTGQSEAVPNVVVIDDLVVDRLLLDDFEYVDAVVRVDTVVDGWLIGVNQAEVVGELHVFQDDRATEVNLAWLDLPVSTETEDGSTTVADPLAGINLRDIPPMRVDLAAVALGGELWGDVRFDVNLPTWPVPPDTAALAAAADESGSGVGGGVDRGAAPDADVPAVVAQGRVDGMPGDPVPQDQSDEAKPVTSDTAIAERRTAAGAGNEELSAQTSNGANADVVGIEVTGIEGTLRGANLRDGRLRWWQEGTVHRTQFDGVVSTSDLAGVLTQWGYAPSIASPLATLNLDVGWPGSPAAVTADRLSGALEVAVEDGRFVQMEGTNALQVLGIFDFASIARRARLDFSDVFGKGLQFDRATGRMTLDRGVLRFVEPLEIRGPGSEFSLNGEVNLVAGELNNVLVVTLPLSRTLPWYAAYAMLTANPLAGAGAIVAERLFRRQIDQFSSAKYRVAGTIDEPLVRFVSVFDRSMDADLPQATPIDIPSLPTPIPAVDPEAVPIGAATLPDPEVTDADAPQFQATDVDGRSAVVLGPEG